MNKCYKIFCGSGCMPLAERVSFLLDCNINHNTEVGQFNNSETMVELNMDGKKTAYIMQSFGAFVNESNKSVNDLFMELVLMANSAKNNGADKIIAIIPCFGYARQDKVDFNVGNPLGSAVISEFLQCKTLNIDFIYTVDIHSDKTGHYFINSNFQNLSVAPVFANRISKYIKKSDNICIVSPDKGATHRNMVFRSHIESYIGREVSFAIIDKKRGRAGEIKYMVLSGCGSDIKGKICIIVDDIADTCGTLCKSSEILINNGASEVWAAITHPVLSKNSQEKIENSNLKYVFISDSITLPKVISHKFKLISIDFLLATVIDNIETGGAGLSKIYKIGILNSKTKLGVKPKLNSTPKRLNEIQMSFLCFSEKSISYDQPIDICSGPHPNVLYSLNGLKVAVLSNDPDKISAVNSLNSTWLVSSIISKNYVPNISKPIGVRDIQLCLDHSYSSVSFNNRWGFDMIIGIEKGFELNNKHIMSITQVAIWTPTGKIFLKPHVIKSRYKFIKKDGSNLLTDDNLYDDAVTDYELYVNKNWRDFFNDTPTTERISFDKILKVDKFYCQVFDVDTKNLFNEAFLSNTVYGSNLQPFIHQATIRKYYKVISDSFKNNLDRPLCIPYYKYPSLFKAVVENIAEYCKTFNISSILTLSHQSYMIASAVSYELIKCETSINSDFIINLYNEDFYYIDKNHDIGSNPLIIGNSISSVQSLISGNNNLLISKYNNSFFRALAIYHTSEFIYNTPPFTDVDGKYYLSKFKDIISFL